MLGQNVAAAEPLPLPIAPALPIEIVLNQQELAVNVSATAANVGVQFGLLGALIGSAIENEQAKKAEAAVVPMRNLLIDYHFEDQLEQALRSKLPSDGISPNPTFVVLKTQWDAVDAQNSQHVPLQALVIIPRYSVDSDFGQATVQLNVQVVDREIKPDGKIKAKNRFFRTYAFHFPLVEEKDVENVGRWQAMGKERLEAMFNEGIAQTTDVLVHDLSADGRKEWPMKEDAQKVTIKGRSWNGVLVQQTPNWVWLRTGWSRGQTLQGYEPVDEHDAVAAATAPAPTTAVSSTTATATTQSPAPVVASAGVTAAQPSAAKNTQADSSAPVSANAAVVMQAAPAAAAASPAPAPATDAAAPTNSERH